MPKYKRVEFRLTEKQAKKIFNKAEKAKMTIPAFSKRMALEGVVVVYPAIEDNIFLRTQLKKIGTNINQYVRLANCNQNADVELTKKLIEQLVICERLLSDYLEPKKEVWK